MIGQRGENVLLSSAQQKALQRLVEKRFSEIGQPSEDEGVRTKDGKGRMVERRSDYSRVAWNDALGPIPNQPGGGRKVKLRQLEDMAECLGLALEQLFEEIGYSRTVVAL